LQHAQIVTFTTGAGSLYLLRECSTFAVMGVRSLLGNLVMPWTVLDCSLPTFVGVALLLVVVIVDRRMTKVEGAFLLTFRPLSARKLKKKTYRLINAGGVAHKSDGLLGAPE
jgi:hypothetical protein